MTQDFARRFNKKERTFMAHHIAQYWVDLALWDIFLNRHADIASIVELGTGYAGLSLFLALQAYQRGGLEFWTFDRVRHSDNLQSRLSKLLGLEARYVHGDIFKGARPKLIKLLVELPRPVLLFCDNGDKPREFREFVPHLRPGDYVGVHDWGTEVLKKDVTIPGCPIVPLYWGEWAKVGSIIRFMRVK